MSGSKIRTNQLIEPFGPGSIYTDNRGTPHVIAGLDFWFQQWDQVSGTMSHCLNGIEFERFEARLSQLLRIDRFCIPPDYRHVRAGYEAPPNSGLKVPALRFPRWYRQTDNGRLKKFNLQTVKMDKPAKDSRWQPVRFISVCSGGHLNEFPWKEWINCQCPGDGSLELTDRGGSELTSIRVRCTSCPEGSQGDQGKSLAKTTIMPDVDSGEKSEFERVGIRCPGDRPWLGEDAREHNCRHPLVGALINQTNLYFARTLSSISLPDLKIQDSDVITLRNEIETIGTLGVAKTTWNMGEKLDAVELIKSKLRQKGVEGSDDKIHEALESIFSGSSVRKTDSKSPSEQESELLAFRRQEFDIISKGIDDINLSPNLSVIKSAVPVELNKWISKINLVDRLREVKAFYGFDRLKPNPSSIAGMPDSALKQLFRNIPDEPQKRWLPVLEVFGEGIFIEFNEDQINNWQNENEVWIKSRLNHQFIGRLVSVLKTLPPLTPADWRWASRYLLVHSFSHILINQLVFECGYSTASLRERLYVSSDRKAPMAAILIYTAAGDSEGTLGGLVRVGHPEKFGHVIQRAIARASWCSVDPICSEHMGGTGSMLANLAACHSCVLLPETSCETINQGLDRAMIVGLPNDRSPGYMASLLTELYNL